MIGSNMRAEKVRRWLSRAAFVLLMSAVPWLVAQAGHAAEELAYPPQLPGGEAVVTDRSPDFLTPSPNLRDGVEVATTPPVVDFAYYPGQDHPGRPWSVWGDGCVANGKYYSAIGDHQSPRGTAQLYEYDPAARKLRLLVDVRKFLEGSGALPPGMNYTPGKIHSRIQMGSDGWLYYSTHRGSARTTTDQYGYLGDWILRTRPETGETEIVAAHPVPKHCIPASTLDAQRLIFYGGTAAGADADLQGVQFLAYDIRNRKVLKIAPGGFDRYVIFSKTSGKLFWEGRSYDPQTNSFGTSSAPHVRSATVETADGWVYGTSGRSCELWGFNVRTGELVQLGQGAVARAEYTTTIEVDPTGRYLYYVPGGHGGGKRDGTPIVQFDLKRRQRKVIAFLHDYYYERYGYSMDGTFSTALDEKGETLYVTWNGMRKPSQRWECCAMVAIHIPESERQP